MEHPREDLAAYAIGALDAGDRDRVAVHLEACGDCRTDVDAFAEVAWSVAEGSARTPPPALRGRILVDSAPRPAAPVGRAAKWWAPLLRPVPMAVPLALVLLLVVSLAGLRAARTDADSYAAAVADVMEGRVVSLAAAEGADARGALVLPRSGDPYLILRIPPPPQGKTFEAWVVRGQTPLAAGITGSRSGVVNLTLTQAVTSGDTVVVTIEDAEGVPAPKGPAVLQGRT